MTQNSFTNPNSRNCLLTHPVPADFTPALRVPVLAQLLHVTWVIPTVMILALCSTLRLPLISQSSLSLPWRSFWNRNFSWPFFSLQSFTCSHYPQDKPQIPWQSIQHDSNFTSLLGWVLSNHQDSRAACTCPASVHLPGLVFILDASALLRFPLPHKHQLRADSNTYFFQNNVFCLCIFLEPCKHWHQSLHHTVLGLEYLTESMILSSNCEPLGPGTHSP